MSLNATLDQAPSSLAAIRLIWPRSWAAIAAAVAAIAGCGSAARSTSRPRAVTALPAGCSLQPPAGLPAPDWAAARRQLAPAGGGAIRLCRYSGVNARPRLTLVSSRLLDAPALVRQLESEFNHLPSPHGVVACPNDDGSQILALVTYPGGHQVSISVGLSGCALVTNGSVHRTAAGPGSASGPRLVKQLEQLLGEPHRTVPAARS